MTSFRPLLAALGSIACLAAAGPAGAQGTYPDKPIRIIVPFPAGGVVDGVARIVGQGLSSKYGQPVIVENKPGAGGALGTGVVGKAPPDGYTLLMVSPSHAVAPSLQKGITWDPVRDFRGVAGFGVIPNVIVVHPSVPAKSMKEFIELARSSKEPMTYASSGVGTSSHLTGELLAQSAKVELAHVPYKGQPDATSDLLSGRVNMMPMSTSLALPYIKAGKLVALGVTTARPSSLLPQAPPIAEAAGLPGFDVGTWLAMLAPAKVPESILKKLSDDVAEVLARSDVKPRIEALGLEGDFRTGPQVDALVKEEVARWSRVVKQAGIRAE
ncbi:MAG: tripartite tricarboxylate transporter substrate binding protein [Variovorax sp.]|nr:tripartite tricarboxylate transporter substrate binding protein [Variovorax sp.]